MHGRPRQPHRALSPDELGKLEKYTKHKNMAIGAYRKMIVSPATCALTASLLTINPDFYTLFNFRKEQTLTLLCAPDADPFSIWSAEMTLSSAALKKQPKSYSAWYHRQWVINTGGAYINIDDELKLCSHFLSLDARNFHCWNYRRYLAKIGMGSYIRPSLSPAEAAAITSPEVRETLAKQYLPFTHEHICCSPESELAFTTSKIASDFSNYSAWHYRSILLPLVFLRTAYGVTPDLYLEMNNVDNLKPSDKDSKHYSPAFPYIPLVSADNSPLLHKLVLSPTKLASLVLSVISNELDIVRRAYTLTPTDQSPWLYHRWVVGLLLSLNDKLHVASQTSVDGVGSFTPSTRIPKDYLRALVSTEDAEKMEKESHFKEIYPLQTIISTLSKYNPTFARTLIATQMAIIAHDCDYILHQLLPLEPEATSILLVLPIISNALTTITSDIVVSENPVLTVDDESLKQCLSNVATSGYDDINIDVIQFSTSHILQQSDQNTTTISPDVFSDCCQKLIKEIADLECFSKLEKYDPMRKGFYQEINSKNKC